MTPDRPEHHADVSHGRPGVVCVEVHDAVGGGDVGEKPRQGIDIAGPIEIRKPGEEAVGPERIEPGDVAAINMIGEQ